MATDSSEHILDLTETATTETDETPNANKKDPDALKTIGEVASLLDVPTHVLRFWEGKFKQIKPIKRRGGHRYYRPEDITTITDIKALLHDRGFTIKGAQKYLKDAKKKKNAADNQHELFPEIAVDEPTTSAPPETKKEEYLQSVLNELIELRTLLVK